MRASVIALLAVLSVALPATAAQSHGERSPMLTFKVVTLNGERRVLSRHATDPYTYSLSPDHKELAYIAQRNAGERNAPVMVASVRSPGERVLADTGCPFYGVSWAPNGRHLALDASAGAYCYWAGLWFVHPDGSGFHQVRERGAPLVWSPDSRFLAGSRPISVFSLETGEERVLSQGHSPSWSPDGTRIAFVRNSVIGVIDLPSLGGAPRVIGRRHESWTRGSYPSWSPDGSRIAFIRFHGDAYHLGLWVAPSGGGKPRRLARGLAPTTPFIWSPRGRQIVYVRGRTLFVRKLSGREGRNLAYERGADTTPLAWSRDGRRILYFTLKR
jgi:WD40-like Beta Propeller Repeat